jgi:hypothetical protein
MPSVALDQGSGCLASSGGAPSIKNWFPSVSLGRVHERRKFRVGRTTLSSRRSTTLVTSLLIRLHAQFMLVACLPPGDEAMVSALPYGHGGAIFLCGAH